MKNTLSEFPVMDLATVPSLEERHLQLSSVTVPKFGKIEAFLPASAEYQCREPHAPALVLVPGLGMDAVGFLRQLPLAAHAHVHLFQMPNNPSREDAGLDGFSRLVEEYIFAKGLDRHPGGVIVGGCSMGGAVSLSLALRGRVRLRGLLLIGTFGSCQHLPRLQRFCAPLAWLVPVHLVHGIVGKRIARSKAFGEVSPEEIEWLVSIKQQRSRTYFGSAVAALTRQEQIAAARKLDIPTLVLHGTDDRVLPLAAGVELAENIPNAEFVQIEGAGHAVFFTHYQQTNAAIASFILK